MSDDDEGYGRKLSGVRKIERLGDSRNVVVSLFYRDGLGNPL